MELIPYEVLNMDLLVRCLISLAVLLVDSWSRACRRWSTAPQSPGPLRTLPRSKTQELHCLSRADATRFTACRSRTKVSSAAFRQPQPPLQGGAAAGGHRRPAATAAAVGRARGSWDGEDGGVGEGGRGAGGEVPIRRATSRARRRGEAPGRGEMERSAGGGRGSRGDLEERKREGLGAGSKPRAGPGAGEGAARGGRGWAQRIGGVGEKQEEKGPARGRGRNQARGEDRRETA
ncbi:uncharacterized protein A4U43_C10F770 [Asparagus officinalis]|uniref:Uncharacterized protein n=1 Tax=Asparagus officinalis TaxID=4686 RepID=A0A5P1E410_ASPOF|nr:uncharacterized protein A4U43_C10F770 [Asparagus officinalis]